ncbi:MAG: S8 family serine peptidase [bacterium]|nr:S8 family serine peptidase [bacterium]
MTMHLRTLIALTAAGLAFAFAAVPPAGAAEHSPALDEIVAAAGERQTVPVILFLDGRLTMDDVYPVARSLPMTKRRAYVVATLKARFQDMGARVMARLEAARKTGEVSLLRPLWVMNAVRVNLTPGLLKEVEDSFPEIIYIGADPLRSNTLDEIGWGVQDMQAPRVWSNFGANGSGVIVGHRDSGVDYTHPGFAGHLWINPGEDLNHNGTPDPEEQNGMDDDGNGYTDDFYGWDFDNDRSDVYDYNSHDTRTASVISAGFSPCDTVSVAPGAKLMVLAGYRTQGAVWEGSQYAIEMGAQVISASVSFKHSDCNDTGVRECPDYVGHRIVSEMELAAGLLHANSTGNYGYVNPVPFSAAAPSNCPPPVPLSQPQQGGVSSIIAVAAYNIGGSWETYSGHGPSAWSRLDICVHARMPFCGPTGSGNEYPPQYNDYPFQNRQFPGLIKPDLTAPTIVNSLARGGGCSSITGTSGACPHVGGACALIFSKFPGITPEDAYVFLVSYAEDAGTAGLDTLWGFGKVRPLPACSSGVNWLASLAGTVEREGLPLAGVRVSAAGSLPAFSDTAGTYQLWLLAGIHDVLFEKYGCNDTTMSVTLAAGQTQILNLSLTAAVACTVSGIVTAGGQPQPGIPISIPEAGLETTSGEGGAFSFNLFAGSYELRAGVLPWDDYAQTIHLNGPPLNLNIALSRSPRALPSGPDGHCYFIYDEYDTPRFTYSWLEINPDSGGLPGQQLSVGNDATVIVNLPFIFRFYGTDFSQLTVSANGFIIPGSSSSIEWGCFPIPSSWAPNGYLAPWFADWKPQDSGGVFFYAETDSHRVIVEWSQVPDYYARGIVSFEAIFYDPLYAHTPTGDGEVKYQYQSFSDMFEGAIGIENLDGSDGIQYDYLTHYDPHAAPLSSGRALLITTDSASAVQPPPVALPEEFSLEPNFPNPFNPLTTFAWRVPREMRVRLAVYDLLGREAAVVFDGLSSAGVHRRSFDGARLATGVYFARLETAGQTAAVRKVVLLK